MSVLWQTHNDNSKDFWHNIRFIILYNAKKWREDKRIQGKIILISTQLKQWNQVCVTVGLFVLFWRGCVCVCVCVREGGRSRREGGGAFPCSWGEGEKPLLQKRLKSYRNSNNAFPAWATARLIRDHANKQGKNAREHRKEGRFMFVTSFCTRKKWREI